MKRSFLRVIGIAGMMLWMLTGGALAAEYRDTDDHWAKTQIEKWSDMGLIKGADGTFRPNDPITRGEMAVILDRIMRYQTKGENNFTDLGQIFYTDAVLKANRAGVIRGNDGAVRPGDQITREEAAVMLGRAFGIGEVSPRETVFSDTASISPWAAGFVNAMHTKGYIGGLPDGSFAPKSGITRAEVVTILDKATKALYHQAGTYTGDVGGTVVVNTAGIVLENMTIQGDLIIAEGVGDGDATLNNVRVEGNTIVRGGGKDSFKVLGNSFLGNVIVARVDGAVRVFTDNEASVEVVEIADGSDDVVIEGAISILHIQAKDILVTARNAQITDVQVTAEGAELTVDKNSAISTIGVTAPDAAITVAGAVKNINADKSAEGASIIAEKGGVITTVRTEAPGSEIRGEGKVQNAEIKANDVKIDTVGTKAIVDKGVTGTTSGGKDIPSGTTSTTGTASTTTGGGGTSGGSSTPSITLSSASFNPAGTELIFSCSVEGATFALDGIEVLPIYENNVYKLAFAADRQGTYTLTAAKSGYKSGSVTIAYTIPATSVVLSEANGVYSAIVKGREDVALVPQPAVLIDVDDTAKAAGVTMTNGALFIPTNYQGTITITAKYGTLVSNTLTKTVETIPPGIQFAPEGDEGVATLSIAQKDSRYELRITLPRNLEPALDDAKLDLSRLFVKKGTGGDAQALISGSYTADGADPTYEAGHYYIERSTINEGEGESAVSYRHTMIRVYLTTVDGEGMESFLDGDTGEVKLAAEDGWYENGRSGEKPLNIYHKIFFANNSSTEVHCYIFVEPGGSNAIISNPDSPITDLYEIDKDVTRIDLYSEAGPGSGVPTAGYRASFEVNNALKANGIILTNESWEEIPGGEMPSDKITFNPIDDIIAMADETTVDSSNNTYVLELTNGTPKEILTIDDVEVTGLPPGLSYTVAGNAANRTITITVSGGADSAVTADISHVSVLVKKSAVSEADATDADGIATFRVTAYVPPAGEENSVATLDQWQRLSGADQPVTIAGNITLHQDDFIEWDGDITIAEGYTLSVESGATLSFRTIVNKGTLENGDSEEGVFGGKLIGVEVQGSAPTNPYTMETKVLDETGLRAAGGNSTRIYLGADITLTSGWSVPANTFVFLGVEGGKPRYIMEDGDCQVTVPENSWVCAFPRTAGEFDQTVDCAYVNQVIIPADRSFNISESITLDKILKCRDDAFLTVKQGATLTLNGFSSVASSVYLVIEPDATLVNNTEMSSYQGITNNGIIHNTGSITIGPVSGGALVNNGIIHNAGSITIDEGSSYTGAAPTGTGTFTNNGTGGSGREGTNIRSVNEE